MLNRSKSVVLLGVGIPSFEIQYPQVPRSMKADMVPRRSREERGRELPRNAVLRTVMFLVAHVTWICPTPKPQVDGHLGQEGRERLSMA
jgi:hypothetical protein